MRNQVRERSRAAVALVQQGGKVRKNPPDRGTMSASTPEPELGKKFFSLTEERKGTKSEAVPPPLRFVPEARDLERLLPRLREAGRR